MRLIRNRSEQKMNIYKAICYIAVTCIFFSLRVAGVSDRFVFKINSSIREIEDNLRVFNFIDVLKITPDVYSFKYAGSLDEAKIKQVISEIKQIYVDKIVEIAQAKEYTKWIPMDITDVMPAAGHENDLEVPNQGIEEHFGMNIEAVWLLGYNGSGINIAVTDVGVNTDITDLVKCQDMALAFNFIDNTRDVTPEEFHSYQEDSLRYVDHGNAVSSIIGAEKGNELCGAGIAYGAKVVPLKIFAVEHNYHIFKLHTSSDIIGAALAYSLQDIHIYSNSWSYTTTLAPLDMAIREAVIHGATKGRNRLGAIYVVPDGSDGISGSGLANSVYTIAVNSVGVNGTMPSKPQVSACVLTSGLEEGSKLNTTYMLTSSYKNKCRRSFKGVSAAVAEVSAIIGLVLQARPDLTVRDIQHLLVESSDRQRLEVAKLFQRNAAGIFFNQHLGFGLIDAEKMMKLAETWLLVQNVYNNTLHYGSTLSVPLRKSKYQQTVRMMSTIEFSIEEDRCNPHVNTIEHVVLRINHEVIKQGDTRLEVVSPSDTESIMIDNTVVTNLDNDTAPRELASVHFWGESPFGQWKVRIQSGHRIDTKDLSSTSLTVYGTFNETKQKEKCTRTSHEPEWNKSKKPSKAFQSTTHAYKKTRNIYKIKSTGNGATRNISNDACIYFIVFVALLYHVGYL